MVIPKQVVVTGDSSFAAADPSSLLEPVVVECLNRQFKLLQRRCFWLQPLWSFAGTIMKNCRKQLGFLLEAGMHQVATIVVFAGTVMRGDQVRCFALENIA